MKGSAVDHDRPPNWRALLNFRFCPRGVQRRPPVSGRSASQCDLIRTAATPCDPRNKLTRALKSDRFTPSSHFAKETDNGFSSTNQEPRLRYARVHDDIRATRKPDYVNNFWKVLADDSRRSIAPGRPYAAELTRT